MRKAESFGGFFLALFFNLLINYPLGLITLILWVLHLWLGIPGFIPLIGLAVWFSVAFFITAFLSLFAWLGESPSRKRVKRNAQFPNGTDSMANYNQPSEIIGLPNRGTDQREGDLQVSVCAKWANMNAPSPSHMEETSSIQLRQGEKPSVTGTQIISGTSYE